MPDLSVQTVQQDSIVTVAIAGTKDGTGALLDNTNASWYVTVTDAASGASILPQTPMTYSGTPGAWSYNVPATDWGTPYDDRKVVCQEYDETGSGGTLRLTLACLGRIAAASRT